MKKFFSGLVKDLIEQAWTLLGLGTAWVLLEGSARELVGNMILITLGFWAVTYVIRREKDDE
jgi:hypothetical protein